MARKKRKVLRFFRRLRTPTTLEVETLTGENLTVTFGMRRARRDDLMESSPGHIPNGTLYELPDEVAWAQNDDFKRRGTKLPIFPWTLDADIEEWKPELRKWADRHAVPHDLILLRRSPNGYLMAFLPVVRQQRMLKRDAQRFRDALIESKGGK